MQINNSRMVEHLLKNTLISRTNEEKEEEEEETAAFVRVQFL